MRLFPVDRYLSVVRDTTDDTELRDVLRYFRLLAQGAEANGDDDQAGDAEGTTVLVAIVVDILFW